MANIYKTVTTVEVELSLNSGVEVYEDTARPGRFKVHFSYQGLDLIITMSHDQITVLFSKMTVAEARASGVAAV